MNFYFVFQKQNKVRDSLLSSAKELISLRKQQALKWGFHRTATVTDDVYSFVRYTKGASYNKYLVAINLGDYPGTAHMHLHTHAHTGRDN